MGFYDCRCMITRVSLKGAEAALVPLLGANGVYSPIALAVKGNYNRLGSIDGIGAEYNSRRITKYLLQAQRDGRFVVDDEYLEPDDRYPMKQLEAFLQACERNMNDFPQTAILNGRPVVFALIARTVWDQLRRNPPQTDEPLETVLARLLRGNPTPDPIYADVLDHVEDDIWEFAAVDAFLTARSIAWAPTTGGDQDYADDMGQYLKEARQTFKDSEVILEALRDYEREVRGLLRD